LREQVDLGVKKLSHRFFVWIVILEKI
jgi:hypothetical protein